MADTSKAQKLASARKKFKELKREKQKNSTSKVNEPVESPPTSREQTPVENVINLIQLPSNGPAKTPEIPNYFDNVNYANSHQQSATFFDTFTYNDPNSNSGNVFSQTDRMKDANPNLNSYFDQEITQQQHAELSTPLQTHQNTEILPQEIPNDISSEVDVQPQEFETNHEPALIPEQNVNNTQYVTEDASDFHLFDSVKFDKTPQDEHSNVESLRQLSEQMTELINPDSDFLPSTFESDLQARNQELATLLDQEKVKTEKLSATLVEYQGRLAHLETEIKDRQLNTDVKVEQELGKLRSELQSHIQTIGILVAEKTELSASLSQFQITAKQKSSECEELQARLKASRSRVADLERELNTFKTEKSQVDNQGRAYIDEIDKVKRDYTNLKDEKDELLQDLLEVREKLKNSSETNLVLQQQLGEVSSQLSMANIKIQQLTTGEIDQVSGQVERLTQEKFALEKQLADLNQTIKTLTKEREESTLQNQQYAQQLNAQLNNLAIRIEKLQKENESLAEQEQSRIRHIGELEKQLQNLQNEQMIYATQRNSGESRAELEASMELVQRLQAENNELQEERVKIANEKHLLLKDLEAKDENMRELEGLIEELKGNQPDSAKLLAIMESDKIAAARAVSQNAEMKRQMESMQEVFIKLNNDKVDLTESLTMEQRNNKDLMEKLQKTELHLQTLADAIEIKDKELCNLRDNSFELNRQVLQSEQLTDRLRHYEAQDHSSHSLQNELQEANLQISKLTDEIHHLKQQYSGVNQTNDNSEIVQLKQQLENLSLRNKELEDKLNSVVNGDKHEISSDANHNDNLDKEAAMKHLERKFMKTMEDIANLTEEKQRLEHLVLQLQSETETIGEYVALYQHQRSILKQKAIEKDQQLTQLAEDREHIKSKLEKLNELVRKLVVEKGSVPSELLEHHESLSRDSKDLCEEHARIHHEINRIAQNNISNSSNNGVHQSSETAEEIIALLTEIKSSNLVQPTENFHHCPWCSGQLITV